MLSSSNVYSNSSININADSGQRKTLTFRSVVIRHGPIAVQCDTNLATLRRLELVTVELRGAGGGEDDAVTDTVTKAVGRTTN